MHYETTRLKWIVGEWCDQMVYSNGSTIQVKSGNYKLVQLLAIPLMPSQHSLGTSCKVFLLLNRVLTAHEAQKTQPGAWKALLHGDEVPGGESVIDVELRASQGQAQSKNIHHIIRPQSLGVSTRLVVSTKWGWVKFSGADLLFTIFFPHAYLFKLMST